MLRFMRYVMAVLLGAGLVALASLVWPKFTTEPQPEILSEVRNAVLGTEIGQEAAQRLRVNSESVQPLNMNDTISSAAGVVTSLVEQKVQQFVSDQVVSQVVKQYQQLPVTQQERVVEMICKPKE